MRKNEPGNMESDLKITTQAQAEAAIEAATEYYRSVVIAAAQRSGGKATLSKLLGYKSAQTVHNALTRGELTALRRIAEMIE